MKKSNSKKELEIKARRINPLKKRIFFGEL
jgi:hypothetical protein